MGAGDLGPVFGERPIGQHIVAEVAISAPRLGCFSRSAWAVTPRFLIGSGSAIISDRRVTGTTVVEAASLATINWFDRALARAGGALQVVHGKTAGNIVEITAPAIEMGKITQGQTDEPLNYSLPLSFVPVTGRDELIISAR